MQRIKKITAMLLSIVILSSFCVFGASFSAGASGTGAGLAEWALNAYYSGWSYVYGGCTPGAVDCSGLIYSYCGGDRVGDAQLGSSTESGSVSAGIPRVHGLGLYQPGHVGVYIADGMAVDARGDNEGVCYSSVDYMGWTTWFKLSACSYVTNGWEQFNGGYYYYEDGQYVVSTSRTIDGVTYNFDSTGLSDKTPGDMSSTASSNTSSESSDNTEAEAPSVSEVAVYSNGSQGDEVITIQERLAELGYYTGEITGYFDDATEAAYIAFQTAAGLTVDGISGSDRDVLYSDDAPYAPAEVEEETVEEETSAEETVSTEPEYKLGDENETVRAIQEQLAALGYFDIEITGYFGDYTEQAVMNFQLANNLWATGVVNQSTYDTLFGEDSVAVALTVDETESSVETGPFVMPESIDASQYIIENSTNQSYADTAVEVVKKTNKVTKKALSNSAAVLPKAISAEAQRNMNVGLWFGVIAVILAVIGGAFLLRERKSVKFEKSSKKKRRPAYTKTNSDVTYW